MKKFLRLLLIIIVVGIIGYLTFIFIVMPSANNSQTALAESYFINIGEDNLCETHFNDETISYCTTFQNLLKSETIIIDSVVKSGEIVNVTITIGSTSEVFEVTFIATTVTGVKGFFNKTYYKIDMIE